jgi:hypothetical protein
MLSDKEKTRRDIQHTWEVAEKFNENSPVKSRQMTQEEIEQIFGGNPDYIKEIKVSE